MATSASQPTFENRFNNPVLVREESLGKVYQADDSESGYSRVAVLQVKALITRIPPATHNRLRAAVQEARDLAIDTLIPVRDSKLERDDSDWYIVMAWVEDRTLRYWLAAEPALPEPTKLSQLVAMLAQGLEQVGAKAKWLRPDLHPDKIYIVPNAEKALGIAPVLVDLGLAATLLNQPDWEQNNRFDAAEQVHRLGRLLTVLLLGDLNLWQEQWGDGAVVAGYLAKIRKRYPTLPPHLYTALEKALTPDLGARYTDIARFVAALQGTQRSALQQLLKRPPTPAEQKTSQPPIDKADKGQAGSTVPMDKTTAHPITARPITARPPTATTALPAGGQSAPPSTGAATASSGRANRGGYQLVVADESNPAKPQQYPIQEELVTAGESASDAIRLPAVGPQRLYFVSHRDLEGRPTGRYTVTDTGGNSRNAPMTLLDGVPLSPYYAALLPERAELTILNYRLSWSVAQTATLTQPPRAASPLQVPQRAFAGHPNERLTIPTIIQNLTKQVERFWLVVDGAPEEWQVITPPEREFLPEDPRVEQPISIMLSGGKRTIAQVYTLTIRLISAIQRVQIAAVTVELELLPAFDYVGSLSPEQVRAGQPAEVYLENHGNVSRIFRVSWRDRSKELLFDPPDSTLVVRPGEIGAVTFAAYPRRWRLFGREQAYPISVVATPQNGGVPQSYAGQVTTRALIPGWAPLVLLALVAAVIAFSALFLKPGFAARIIEPAGAPIAGSPFTLYWTPVNACFYAVYQDNDQRQALTWRMGSGFYQVSNAAPGSVIEVRLRNCLLLAESKWTVPVEAPVATPLPPPQIITFTLSVNDVITEPNLLVQKLVTVTNVITDPNLLAQKLVTVTTVITPPLRIVQDQIGNLCVRWEVTGDYTKIVLEPPVGTIKDLAEAKGEQCLPISAAFAEETITAVSLKVAYGEAAELVSAPVNLLVEQARCYVNTAEDLSLFEGPGDNFPVRVYLSYDTLLYPQARPFAPLEQGGQQVWVQVKLYNDPRPGWVYQPYIYCPLNIGLLPPVENVPATPIPTATTTPTATPTPTPTTTPLPPPPTPQVSVAPDVINLGGCTKVKWDIQNVKEVHLNDEGVVGVAEREDCPTAAGRYTYTWRILQMDGVTVKLERTLFVNPGAGVPVGPPTPPVQ